MDFSFLLAATSAEPTGLMAWIMPILGVLQSLLYVAVGLGFVIFVHELGHFLVAKACGVKCEKFYVGFDFLEIPIPFTKWKIPRALWKMQIGETEYGIGSLPLGGYVKMLGQDDDPRNAEAESERTKALAAGTSAEGFTIGSTIEKTGEALVHTKPADPVLDADPSAQPAVAVKTPDGKTVLLDRRSYTAKSVPARMAIISAGVIMNAIFAVVFATVAYKMGVPEIPSGIGGVAPGDAAWRAGMEPGEKIIAFGDAKPYEWLRYDDLKRNVILNGKNTDLKMLVRNSAGVEKTYEVQPVLREGNKFPTVGLLLPRTTEVVVRKADGVKKAGLERLLPKSDKPLNMKDKIIAVDGQEITTGAQMAALLVQRPRGKLQLTIEREAERPAGTDPKTKVPPTKHEIALDEMPLQDFGVILQMGPVTGVRKGSPAETAGVLVGDRIESIDDKPVGNPLWLGQQLLDRVGKNVVIKVKRSGKDNKPVDKELTATLEAPRNFYPVGYYTSGGIAAAEPLGIAYDLLSTVAEVVPGSSAEKLDIKPGDQLLTATFVQPKREKPDEYDEQVTKLKKYELNKNPNLWLKVVSVAQEVKPDVKLKLEFKRGEKTHSAEIATAASTTVFDESRGIDLHVEIRTHTAKDWSEAFWLGRRETKERLQEVLLVLHRLVTLQLSPTNLSGPPGILTAATQVASDGIPRMLIFLTLLSANLAVINFLPIPVLDGGHMMFLAAEWIRGRPVDAELQYKLTLGGLFFLLSLMIFASTMDITRLYEWLFA